jgi:hypothetical protein
MCPPCGAVHGGDSWVSNLTSTVHKDSVLFARRTATKGDEPGCFPIFSMGRRTATNGGEPKSGEFSVGKQIHTAKKFWDLAKISDGRKSCAEKIRLGKDCDRKCEFIVMLDFSFFLVGYNTSQTCPNHIEI